MRVTNALLLSFACLAGGVLLLGVVALLTAMLGDGSVGSGVSVPYAIAWIAVALAVLGLVIAIPFYPHYRVLLLAITAAATVALGTLIAASVMRSDSDRTGAAERRCASLDLALATAAELEQKGCEASAAKESPR